jgi:hypothetical protein
MSGVKYPRFMRSLVYPPSQRGGSTGAPDVNPVPEYIYVC